MTIKAVITQATLRVVPDTTSLDVVITRTTLRALPDTTPLDVVIETSVLHKLRLTLGAGDVVRVLRRDVAYAFNL